MQIASQLRGMPGRVFFFKVVLIVSINQIALSMQEDPACGWCDDGSNRGTGTCMPGGFSGPVANVLNVRTNLVCPTPQWFFTSCPLCQCNGHSTCIEGTQKCNQPCLHLTEGK